MSVHADILQVSHALDEALKRMAVPHYGTSAAIEDVDRARQFSVDVVMAAFYGNIPHDYGATKVSPEELAALLPQFEGALKIVQVLNRAGVSLPARGSLLERIATAFGAEKGR